MEEVLTILLVHLQVLEDLHTYQAMMDVIVQEKMEILQEKVFIIQILNLKIQ